MTSFDASDANFATTQWSIVLRAQGRSASVAREALAELCQRYWYPLYAYVRRREKDLHLAQDLTQAFFARLLETEFLAAVQPDRGRFRAFLLAMLKNFLANEWDKAKALKRGGGHNVWSLDFAEGENRLAREPVDELTPERAFERQWAITLLEQVMHRLAAEFQAAGKERTFELLKPFIAGKHEAGNIAAAAEQLSLSTGATKVAIHRLRKRYRELLRTEIAHTVATPEEIDDEIRRLFQVLGP